MIKVYFSDFTEDEYETEKDAEQSTKKYNVKISRNTFCPLTNRKCKVKCVNWLDVSSIKLNNGKYGLLGGKCINHMFFER